MTIIPNSHLAVGDVWKGNHVLIAKEYKSELNGFHLHILTPNGLVVEFVPFHGLAVVDKLAHLS